MNVQTFPTRENSVTGSLTRTQVKPLPTYPGNLTSCQVTGAPFEKGHVVCITEDGQTVSANKYRGSEPLKGEFFSFQPNPNGIESPAH